MTAIEDLKTFGSSLDVPYPQTKLSRSETFIYCRTGQGEKHETCGKPKFAAAHYCRGKKHLDFIARKSCKRGTCPECFHDHANRGGRAASARLEGLHAAYDRRGIRLGKAKHGVFAPPPWKWPRERLEKDRGNELLRKCTQYLKDYMKDGAFGGLLVLHGERRKHLDGTDCEKKHCKRSHRWIWSPHVHWVGYGFFDPEDRFRDESGWNFVRIEDGDTPRDIRSTVQYLLTHSAHFLDDMGEEAGDSYRYVGLMAMCKGRREVLQVEHRPMTCEKCQQDLHAYGLLDGEKVNWDFDQGELMEKVEKVRYVINVKRWLFKCRPPDVGE